VIRNSFSLVTKIHSTPSLIDRLINYRQGIVLYSVNPALTNIDKILPADPYQPSVLHRIFSDTDFVLRFVVIDKPNLLEEDPIVEIQL